MKVVVAFFLSCFAVASSSKCDMSSPLPKPSPITNMEQMTGTWYQTVSSNDYISAEYLCGTFARVNVNSASETFTALLTKYYNKGKPRPFNIYYSKTTDGYFMHRKIDHQEIEAHDFDQYGSLNVKAQDEGVDIDLHPKENSFISDGIHYFAYIICTPEGWVVWVHTPQKVLTTEQFLHIHNELVKHGIHTELRLGKCEDINPK